MKNRNPILLMLLAPFYLLGQESFTMNYSFEEFTSPPSIVGIEEGDSTNSILLQKLGGGCSVLRVTNTGAVIDYFTIRDTTSDDWLTYGNYSSNQIFHAITMRRSILNSNPATGVFVAAPQHNVLWGKLLSTADLRQECTRIIGDSILMASHQVDDSNGNFSPVGLTSLQLFSGAPNWTKSYELASGVSNNFRVMDMKPTQVGHLSCLVINRLSGIERANYVLQVSLAGQPVSSVMVKTTTGELTFFDQTVDEAGNLYVLGRIAPTENLQVSTTMNAIILKFSPDLDLLWSKELSADFFTYRQASIQATADGNLAFSYATNDNFPVITGFISPEGQLLNYEGYAAHHPSVAISEDLSFWITSKRLFDADGNWEFANIITRTLPNGGLPNCNTFPACLALEDLEVTVTPTDWEEVDSTPPTSIPLVLSYGNVLADSICNAPPPPSADFTVNERYCLLDTLRPINVNNRLAETQEWHLFNDTVDTTFNDKNFAFLLSEAGEYILSQTIWTLGCSYEHQDTFRVEDPSLDLFGEDRIICTPAPYALQPIVDFGPEEVSYDWGNGNVDRTYHVPTSGTYAVTIDDGVCTYRDSTTLTFLDDISPTETRLQLPLDTTICVESLPYLLQPSSSQAASFLFSAAGSTTWRSGTTFDLYEPGSYYVTATIENCPITAAFQLRTSDCQAKVYLPNVFSPNNDGINDDWYPQGVDFIGLSLQIYDRWGNLQFETQNAPFSWDGNAANQTSAKAVYVAYFTYQNELTGSVSQLIQEVILLR